MFIRWTLALVLMLSVSVAYANESSQNNSNDVNVVAPDSSQEGRVDDGSSDEDTDSTDIAMNVAQDLAGYDAAVSLPNLNY